MAEIAISLPFSLDSYGKVATTTDQRKIWADKVRSVLGTALRERVVRPEFGTLIPFALFETTESAEVEIQNEVTHAFAMQLSLLGLISTEITLDQYTNVMTVTVTYSLPNEEVVSTSVGLIVLTGSAPSYQELL